MTSHPYYPALSETSMRTAPGVRGVRRPARRISLDVRRGSHRHIGTW